MLVIGVVLAALLVATGVALLRPGPLAVVAVVAAGVAWWLVNGPVEGAVLHVVTPTHGLTVADLLVPPLVGLAVLAAVRRRRAASHARAARTATGRRG
ncbi:hypothetical protein [Pseudokineococcus lusitanus]|uniref:Uncharacterized protein n=1 Tax=Pseudokineococcus lusitanus TaxID=763993 RepID=A0A3N1HK29_9ACTN|nr:hypothetical protein [Pseudokineococcus lusitanus]ROP42844.1 hypothetical protein EDC03_2131 [Pseudokineococcus lusitanus]